jgi:hypothetical protein
MSADIRIPLRVKNFAMKVALLTLEGVTRGLSEMLN